MQQNRYQVRHPRELDGIIRSVTEAHHLKGIKHEAFVSLDFMSCRLGSNDILKLNRLCSWLQGLGLYNVTLKHERLQKDLFQFVVRCPQLSRLSLSRINELALARRTLFLPSYPLFWQLTQLSITDTLLTTQVSFQIAKFIHYNDNFRSLIADNGGGRIASNIVPIYLESCSLWGVVTGGYFPTLVELFCLYHSFRKAKSWVEFFSLHQVLQPRSRTYSRDHVKLGAYFAEQYLSTPLYGHLYNQPESEYQYLNYVKKVAGVRI